MISKIVIAGANGFLGTSLAQYFRSKAATIVMIARRAGKPDKNIRWVTWNGETIGDWATELDGAEVLINLAGKNVNCRYTAKNKKEIYDSRLRSTAVLGQAIARCANAPKVWINASSATIYEASFDKLMTEENGVIGHDFSMDVCKQWEAAFNQVALPKTRKILLRTSIVLGEKSAALPALTNLARFGLGGKQGDGKQFVSWIHIRDFCRAVEWLVDVHTASGAYNITAPHPITNDEFMRTLREVMHISFGLNAPRWMLGIGSWIIRTETELVLKSRKVYPKRLLDEGFLFEFPKVNNALQELWPKLEATN
jgi:uncharacterized protein (TIGR01777 family)